MCGRTHAAGGCARPCLGAQRVPLLRRVAGTKARLCRCLHGEIVTATASKRGGAVSFSRVRIFQSILPGGFGNCLTGNNLPHPNPAPAGACRWMHILKTFPTIPAARSGWPAGPAQFTKRLMRMFITMPRARNVNSTDEPPYLNRGRGMPVTGIRPMTMPTLTAI